MKRLDVRGLRCPLPVLKTHRMMKALQAGETLEVLATDKDAPKDVRHYCQNGGHAWLGVETCAQGDRPIEFIIRLRKGTGGEA